MTDLTEVWVKVKELDEPGAIRSLGVGEPGDSSFSVVLSFVTQKSLQTNASSPCRLTVWARGTYLGLPQLATKKTARGVNMCQLTSMSLTY